MKYPKYPVITVGLVDNGFTLRHDECEMVFDQMDESFLDDMVEFFSEIGYDTYTE